MGGRGAASGISDKGKPYGTEFKTLLSISNIKFVQYKDAKSAKPPMETKTSGRVYATVNENGEVKYISYYDKHNKRSKQIDVIGKKHTIDGRPEIPHTHVGYLHEEHGTRLLTSKEKKMVERVLKIWYRHNAGE